MRKIVVIKKCQNMYHYFRLMGPLILCLMTVHLGVAQRKVHVVKKTVERNLTYHSGDQLELKAEKAQISIMAANTDQIQMKVYLISKHEDLEQARKELEYLKLEISYENGVHKVANFFRQTSGTMAKVKGNLTARYELIVPKKCPITISNRYGGLKIENLEGQFVGDLRFVNTDLTNLSGSQDITTYFSEVNLSKSKGHLIGNFRNSNCTISDYAGDLAISAQYGELNVYGDYLKRLGVLAKRTQVNFLAADLRRFNYRLKTSFAKVIVPDFLGDEQGSEYTAEFDTGFPVINIETTYKIIELKQINNSNASNH